LKIIKRGVKNKKKETNKLVISKRINENKDDIITKYKEGKGVYEIAKIYEVVPSTIYTKLDKWGVLKKGQKPRRLL